MQPKRNILHLAIAFDANYITPFYVLLTSIFHHNKDAIFHFHVAAGNVAQNELQQIEKFVHSKNATINFYDAASRLQGISLPVRSYFTLSTYYRLILPDMVPKKVKKLLYLDADTVVIDSLQPLFQTNINGLPLAGVVQHNTLCRPELGIYEPQAYFNAGVLLINVLEWRRQQIFEKSVQFIRSYPHTLKWLDQDVLNAVLANNFKKLDACYNIRHNDIPADLPPKQAKNFLKDKVIIHYTSGNKPWLLLGRNRLRFLYHRYHKMSPRAHENKYADFKPTPPVLYRFVRIRFVEMLANYPLLLHTARKSKKYRTFFLNDVIKPLNK